MNRSNRRTARVVVVLCLALMPTLSWAQTAATGGIAGVVKDTSGAILPGVTVEAASPALIERTRAAVTDGQGQFKILDLRPGTYSVTFSLAGFSAVKRDGIELTTAFTATVNAELTVGSIEETLTVSGEAPTVDTKNVMQSKVFQRETLDSLPVGSSTAVYAAIIPGAVTAGGAQDVGGTQGVTGLTFAIHGGRTNDNMISQDGMQRNILLGPGASALGINVASVQEVTVQTNGISAEAAIGGVQVNVVAKDGGNIFSGMSQFTYAKDSFQSNNVTDALQKRGLDPSKNPGIKQTYLINGSFGGPIRQNKLWFFLADQLWEAEDWVPGMYWNATQGTLRYTPDLSRPAFNKNRYLSSSIRTTLQASDRNKFTFAGEFLHNCNCTFNQNGTTAPEASALLWYSPNYTLRTFWSFPLSNKLLIEAGGGPTFITLNHQRQPGVSPTDIAVTEQSTGIVFNSYARQLTATGNYGEHKANQLQGKLSVSYITGSHAFKVGGFINLAYKDFHNTINGGVDYTVKNGVPVSLREWAQPFAEHDRNRELAVFAQDQWTLARLTLNLGLRLDSLNGYVYPQRLDAGPLVPARDFPAVTNVPNLTDLAPRLGVAYDLSGDGRTAVKAFLGRYVAIESLNGYVTLNNPANLMVTSATRTWTDNGNGVPDCNLADTARNGECGPLSDALFGQVKPGTQYSDQVLHGFGHRNANWQGSVSLQHELRPGLAVDMGFFRTWYTNFSVTENQAVTAADFSPYCITAPSDSRLPNGGGNQICGLFDVVPTLFGKVNNVVNLASHYGKQSDVYNGVDLTIRTRFGKGGQFSGGMSTGRTETNNCDVSLNAPQLTFLNPVTAAATFPRTSAYCDAVLSWAHQTQVKFLLVYPLPLDFQASVTFQSLPGIPIYASYVATNAEVAPSLKRNLSAPGGNVTVDLIPPNTLFEDRYEQLDLRLMKTFRVQRTKMQANLDVYNLLNGSGIIAENTRYGTAAWQTPTTILGGRLVKFGFQFSF